MLNKKEIDEFAAQLLSEIKAAKSICLTTHVNPDGDGLCACLALKRILAYLGYKADFVTDDNDLERYDFLQMSEDITVNHENLKYDLVFVVDLHDYQRLGARLQLVQKAGKVCVIDHHEIEDDMMSCCCSWVDSSAVCTGWMIYALFCATIDKMSKADKEYVGKCLYTTLLNDTNNFTNANTDSHSFELSTAVCGYGVKPHQIYRLFMTSRTSVEMRLLGQVLSTIELYEKGRILFMDSSLAMLQENLLGKEATSNLTRWVQDLKGVETSVYFREEIAGKYRLSLRSKNVNVHSIAIKYGGGGHLQASGCSMTGSLSDLKEIVLNEISQAEKLVH